MRNGGYVSTLGEYAYPGGHDGYAPHELKIESVVLGDAVTISCYVDGVEVIDDVTDSDAPNYTIGQVGVKTHNRETIFDNFGSVYTFVENWDLSY